MCKPRYRAIQPHGACSSPSPIRDCPALPWILWWTGSAAISCHRGGNPVAMGRPSGRERVIPRTGHAGCDANQHRDPPWEQEIPHKQKVWVSGFLPLTPSVRQPHKSRNWSSARDWDENGSTLRWLLEKLLHGQTALPDDRAQGTGAEFAVIRHRNRRGAAVIRPLHHHVTANAGGQAGTRGIPSTRRTS